ncbi:cytochrome c551/c552 [Saccharicrinis fermentans DSM 9555 = JCM 21142]|uniref:Cytochrome c551/c552 n=2 Tax=Saccharicrinis fermentans TaxID=982 RepID=W7Y6D2_9BACT|nr:cytochrome c551/c552 [Saccharicrinis fermentans DSM 9555 = JCM 21142]
MKCMAPYKCQSLFVEVQQLVNDQYKTVLVEMIACDSLTNTIFASGQNGEGVVFVGKGNFLSPQDWVMEDADLLGNKTMDVRFHFNSLTDVLVEGFDTSGNRLWGTRYIKRNPKDKNLGVQLVSVHDNMLENPYETLKQLNRLGFSYIETFVYADGTFYGMSPAVFKNMVALAGLRFEGSMTFYDLPTDEKWDEAILWWKKCIRDHKEAGVSYLSTSNHELKTVKSKHELQRYCDYYNAIGKLCAENGLQFVYHNHADALNVAQIDSLKKFIRKGGGFVGIHAASAAKKRNAWYDGLIGGVFTNHPKLQSAVLQVEDASFPAVMHLPPKWLWSDEWYNFDKFDDQKVHVVLKVDEKTYDYSAGYDRIPLKGMGENHPIAWCHHYDGGRIFSTDSRKIYACTVKSK